MSLGLGQTKQILGHPNTAANGSKYIMIVDDEPDILDLLQGYLESKGWKIKAFIGAGVALMSLMTNPKLYSLIITDIRMPEMSGIEFIKKVKKMDPTIKVIFITAFETEIDELRELSDVEPLKKPLGLETLVNLIKRLKDIQKKDEGFFTCSQCGDSGESPETIKHRPTCIHYSK
ncbi:MAG TPA: response regulator [Nitrososphaeraceae archaeon]|nr:response regulator [Nitrososphaeraceae archaeon]